MKRAGTENCREWLGVMFLLSVKRETTKQFPAPQWSINRQRWGEGGLGFRV